MTVGILTFRRPDGLREALPRLLEQVRQVPGAELLVVDNDDVPSARDIVAEREAAGDPVRYVHEPDPGIVSARNRALDETTGDILVFIDDDEIPSPAWLRTMLATHEEYGCAAVAGAVVAQFEQEPDRWIAEGKFFERKRYPTGTRVPAAGTGNLLLDMRLVREWGLRFDQAFRFTGGSDTAFTSEIVARGGEIVFCDEASIVDIVPVERATRSWVLQRAFRNGNARARVHLLGVRSRGAALRGRVKLAVQGAARVAGGAVRSLGGLATLDTGLRAQGARTAVRGAGMVAGAVGSVYQEYRR
ncbi:glycosyltransferase family 2 protein [Flavimobilis soli]|uniref:glycosyltransferase family 2 protein n=1 Tax=Flavimobilis soli TaxID=442709 RepID=UPI001FEBC540|nr:glycosyltransferase family 2 protein [Flavimobilis soli]